jgi:hypothetical protein
LSEKPSQELNEDLMSAQQQVAVGERYKHYRGLLYTVIAIGLDEKTLEPSVVYKAEYGEKLTWIRPLSDWLKEVEWEGKTVPRFTKI